MCLALFCCPSSHDFQRCPVAVASRDFQDMALDIFANSARVIGQHPSFQPHIEVICQAYLMGCRQKYMDSWNFCEETIQFGCHPVWAPLTGDVINLALPSFLPNQPILIIPTLHLDPLGLRFATKVLHFSQFHTGVAERKDYHGSLGKSSFSNPVSCPRQPSQLRRSRKLYRKVRETTLDQKSW